MAMLNNLYNPDAESQTDFGKLPTGDYVAQIIDSDMKPTKAGGTYLELTSEIIEPAAYKGRKHWERLNLDHASGKVVEIANRQFASVREATGVPNPRDSNELHYRPHIIRVEFYAAGSVQSNGNVRDRDDAVIKSWKKLEGGGQGNAPAASAPAAPSATAASPSDAVPPRKRNAA